MDKVDDTTMKELEALAFRKLVAHLRSRNDVQNIDMMNLAGFCRNCLANWLMEAATETGVTMSKEDSREHVYGMPYEQWRAQNQSEASPQKLAEFEKNRPEH
jgi:hypothetical protein